MKFYIGNTDYDWFHYLSKEKPDDVNFWAPRGKQSFRAIETGAPFVFKLKASYNAIAGVGFFVNFTLLPLSQAWEFFGKGNGCENFNEFRKKILSYREDQWNENPVIGCRVLTNPLFFDEKDWIKVPQDWSRNIVTGKGYSTEDRIGNQLWNKLELLIQSYQAAVEVEDNQLMLTNAGDPEYRRGILGKIRVGQGAFRSLVTDAYSRRCSVSGEKTLPVLEAAHIKPFSKAGPQLISNGLLLRADLHKLFDQGYLTVTNSFNVEVSKKIREEFENGRDYYKYQGSELKFLPTRKMDLPSKEFLNWHNENVFKE